MVHIPELNTNKNVTTFAFRMAVLKIRRLSLKYKLQNTNRKSENKRKDEFKITMIYRAVAEIPTIRKNTSKICNNNSTQQII